MMPPNLYAVAILASAPGAYFAGQRQVQDLAARTVAASSLAEAERLAQRLAARLYPPTEGWGPPLVAVTLAGYTHEEGKHGTSGQ